MAIDGRKSATSRLTSEPETSNNLEDVQHWRSVYSQLLTGFRDIADHEVEAGHPAGSIPLAHLEERFNYWNALAERLRQETTLGARARRFLRDRRRSG